MRVTLRLTPPQVSPADTVSHPSCVDALGHPVLQDVPSLVSGAAHTEGGVPCTCFCRGHSPSFAPRHCPPVRGRLAFRKQELASLRPGGGCTHQGGGAQTWPPPPVPMAQLGQPAGVCGPLRIAGTGWPASAGRPFWCGPPGSGWATSDLSCPGRGRAQRQSWRADGRPPRSPPGGLHPTWRTGEACCSEPSPCSPHEQPALWLAPRANKGPGVPGRWGGPVKTSS